MPTMRAMVPPLTPGTTSAAPIMAPRIRSMILRTRDHGTLAAMDAGSGAAAYPRAATAWRRTHWSGSTAGATWSGRSADSRRGRCARSPPGMRLRSPAAAVARRPARATSAHRLRREAHLFPARPRDAGHRCQQPLRFTSTGHHHGLLAPRGDAGEATAARTIGVGPLGMSDDVPGSSPLRQLVTVADLQVPQHRGDVRLHRLDAARPPMKSVRAISSSTCPTPGRSW